MSDSMVSIITDIDVLKQEIYNIDACVYMHMCLPVLLNRLILTSTMESISGVRWFIFKE